MRDLPQNQLLHLVGKGNFFSLLMTPRLCWCPWSLWGHLESAQCAWSQQHCTLPGCSACPAGLHWARQSGGAASRHVHPSARWRDSTAAGLLKATATPPFVGPATIDWGLNSKKEQEPKKIIVTLSSFPSRSLKLGSHVPFLTLWFFFSLLELCHCTLHAAVQR